MVPTRRPEPLGGDPARRQAAGVSGHQAAGASDSQAASPSESRAASASQSRAGDMAPLGAITRAEGTGVVVELVGELDAMTAQWLLPHVRERVDPRCDPVRLDLSGLTFLDVAGARALSSLDGWVRHAGGRLEPCGLVGTPRRLMQILGLTGFLRGGCGGDPRHPHRAGDPSGD